MQKLASKSSEDFENYCAEEILTTVRRRSLATCPPGGTLYLCIPVEWYFGTVLWPRNLVGNKKEQSPQQTRQSLAK